MRIILNTISIAFVLCSISVSNANIPKFCTPHGCCVDKCPCVKKCLCDCSCKRKKK
jgi:hypothetical protein